MTLRYLSFGSSKNVWMWDDTETPNAIETDANIDAPNIVDITGRLTTAEGDIDDLEAAGVSIDGRLDALEGKFTTVAPGTFTTVDGKTVTVVNGLITSIA